ncbi:unnamed protein product [Allacma fusca]|uniref:Uncharacterized protein n=1 Tax=Allacma fusca TaxID=39272 RepID=A0A8J2K6Q8_9HEXA|nr:unnamed protein product [Allacma fusca]
MKIIILVALCASAAFAAQAPPTAPTDPNAILAKHLQDKTVKTFLAVKNHKNFSKLLEDPPGIIAVMEQFEKSVLDIYEAIRDVADNLAPLLGTHGLMEAIKLELPRIFQEIGRARYEYAVGQIAFWQWYWEVYWGLPPMAPEEIMDMYINYAIRQSLYVVPLEINDGIVAVIDNISSEASLEYHAIIQEGVERSEVALGQFFYVLNEALENASK